MASIRFLSIALVASVNMACSQAEESAWRSMPEVLSATGDSDWRAIEPRNLLHLELESGTVVMQLAPQFAPRHIANLRTLIEAGHFADATIVRSQENYVVQWSADGPWGSAARTLEPEFYRAAQGLDFTLLDSRDAYAADVGFVEGFPAGRDSAGGRAWLTHCYGMLGVGRGMEPDSGNGAELYVVTGHAPRHLDRNVTLIGRVIDGMEHFTTLPRGTGALGFFEDESEQIPIRSIRLGTADDDRWLALRTDTDTFADLVRSRRYRNEEWFLDPAGAVGLCNVPLPVRRVAGAASSREARARHPTERIGAQGSRLKPLPQLDNPSVASLTQDQGIVRRSGFQPR